MLKSDPGEKLLPVDEGSSNRARLSRPPLRKKDEYWIFSVSLLRSGPMSESSMVAQGAPLLATACLKRLHRGYDKYK